MRVAVVLLVCAVLSACGSPRWIKADMTTQARDRDLAECEFEAEKATGSMPTGVSRGIRLADLETRCMRMRGYRVE